MSTDRDPPHQTLKKISQMHDELEQHTEKMSKNLEQLQSDNKQQDDRITKSLSALQLEQKRTRRLLQSRWNTTEDCESQQFADQLSKQLKDWTVSDVIRWLEDRKLHKFIILFQKHHVCGQDLADLNLPFLEDYDHISVDEREILLAEIYHLLNPVSVSVSQEDLTKIQSPHDRQKYFAAIELAQASSDLPRSTSVLVLSSPRTPSLSSSSNQSSPLTLPRFKTESRSLSESRANTSIYEMSSMDTKKRKTMPKTSSYHSPQGKPVSVYDYINQFGPSCVSSVRVPAQFDGSYGISVVTDEMGHVIIDNVPQNMTGQLAKGDRVLEINSISVLGQFNIVRELEALVQTALGERSPAEIVILRPEQITQDNSVSFDSEDESERWTKLRSMLVDMRDTSMDCSSEMADISPETLQKTKDISTIQTEVRHLKDKLKEQERQNQELQADLESKSAYVHDLEMSRDKAIEKLNQSRTAYRNDTTEVRGGTKYYNITMETLNSDNASKEEVLQSLKDIVKEASRQKWYLDRLISLVIEEAPWMLDELDADIDHLTLTDQPEEYC